MRFSEVLRDLEKMVGMRLQSIQRGSEITLLKIDEENGTLHLETSVRAAKTRPLSELEKIWAALSSNDPVHVDSVLGGSGSSRNQPETILANLPYVEWLRLMGKKHLVLNKERTHPWGTLKQMDPLAAEQLKQRMAKDAETCARHRLSQIIVVSGSLREHASVFEHCSGSPGKAVQQGVYEFFTDRQHILLVSQDIVPDALEPGTYPIMNHKSPKANAPRINLLGKGYSLYQQGGASILFCV